MKFISDFMNFMIATYEEFDLIMLANDLQATWIR